MGGTSKRLGSVVGALIAFLAFAQQSLADGESVWLMESDGSWISQSVSIGDHGGVVFSQGGMYDGKYWLLSAYDNGAPTPILESTISGISYYHRTAAAPAAGVFISLHQRGITPGSSVREAVISKWEGGANTPSWEYVMPAVLNGHPYADVEISTDGTKTVAVAWDTSANTTEMAVLSTQAGSEIAYAVIDILGHYFDYQLSGDGSTAVLVSSLELVIVDTTSMTELHDSYLLGDTNYGSLAISRDGARIAYGTDNEVQILDRQAGGGYVKSTCMYLPGYNYCSGLDLSPDGQTVAGTFSFTDGTKRIRAFAQAIDTSTTLMENEVSYTGSFTCSVDKVSIDSNGTRFAVGLWGDELSSIHEVFVYSTGADAPLATFDLPGSVLDLELSPDGAHLAVASKTDHMNNGGGTGRIDYFAIGTPALTLHGVPHSGDTVTFNQPAERGSASRILWCDQPADPPTVFPKVGTLYLDRARMLLLPAGSQAPGSDVVETDYFIERAPGEELYFQGIRFGAERTLSENFIKMTVLP